ncbi:MAG: hypothetical protein SFU98_22530 [Leptospiraceae bacterium]|nr:hypothetical protein [Leptospiraceae bacterium]
MKNFSYYLVHLIIFQIIFFESCKSTENVSSSKEKQVLPLIEKYHAPPMPKQRLMETYDYRISYGNPVPPTLTDTLIDDIWQRIDMDLKIKLTPNQVSEGIVKDALNIYLKRDWTQIAGYRLSWFSENISFGVWKIS